MMTTRREIARMVEEAACETLFHASYLPMSVKRRYTPDEWARIALIATVAGVRQGLGLEVRRKTAGRRSEGGE